MKIKNIISQIGGKKAVIILTVFVDVLGIGIVIPIMPFYVESFGVTPFFITLLFAVFSLFAFLSAPFLGALSDKIGRRPVLLMSIFSTAVGWFVFAGAGSILFLFIGRIIDGLAAGNFSTAQSYLVDISKDEKERTTNLGLTGAIFGVGLIIGPMLGGLLSTISPAFPFWFAGCLAIINFIGAFFFLPETHHERDAKKKIQINPLAPIIRSVKDNSLRSRYLAWFLFAIAIAIQQSIFALYLDYQFGFTAAMVGYLLSAMGIVMVINQGILLKRFWLKYFKESSLEIWLFLLFAVGFILVGIGNIYILILGLLFLIFPQSILRIVVSSSVAGIAGKEKRGESLGVMSSVMALGMVIAPPLAGLLFEKHHSMPFLISAFFVILAFLVMKFYSPRAEKFVEQNPPVAF